MKLLCRTDCGQCRPRRSLRQGAPSTPKVPPGVIIALGAAALLWCNRAPAQIHSLDVGKSCAPKVCVGESLDCRVLVSHNDGFGDRIRILAVWDVIDPEGEATRVPRSGDLPIITVFGNTTCTVGGSLPCDIGAANSTLDGLPGGPWAGLVIFQQNTYVVGPTDLSPLQDQARIKWQDACDHPDTIGCSKVPNTFQIAAATELPDCDDGSNCTTDTCMDGVCRHEPLACDDGVFCNGVETCIDGVCRPGAPPDCTIWCETPCCLHGHCDLETDACGVWADPDGTRCDDGEPGTCGVCAESACIPDAGYVCDDENPCTADHCEDPLGCIFTPNDSNACDDGLFCNGEEQCQAGECRSTGNPCAAGGLVCDEHAAECVCPTVTTSAYWSLFGSCFEAGGPGMDVSIACRCLDLDADLDVDLMDFAILQCGFAP